MGPYFDRARHSIRFINFNLIPFVLRNASIWKKNNIMRTIELWKMPNKLQFVVLVVKPIVRLHHVSRKGRISVRISRVKNYYYYAQQQLIYIYWCSIKINFILWFRIIFWLHSSRAFIIALASRTQCILNAQPGSAWQRSWNRFKKIDPQPVSNYRW